MQHLLLCHSVFFPLPSSLLPLLRAYISGFALPTGSFCAAGLRRAIRRGDAAAVRRAFSSHCCRLLCLPVCRITFHLLPAASPPALFCHPSFSRGATCLLSQRSSPPFTRWCRHDLCLSRARNVCGSIYFCSVTSTERCGRTPLYGDGACDAVRLRAGRAKRFAAGGESGNLPACSTLPPLSCAVLHAAPTARRFTPCAWLF